MADEKHNEISELINIVERSGRGDDELEKQLVGALYGATISYARTIICGRSPPNDTTQFYQGYGKYIKCMNVINNSIKELKRSLKES